MWRGAYGVLMRRYENGERVLRYVCNMGNGSLLTMHFGK